MKELDDTEHWFVDMGPLNRRNGPGSYALPTEAAAIRFATNHKQIARDSYGVDRVVTVRYPDGRTWEV